MPEFYHLLKYNLNNIKFCINCSNNMVALKNGENPGGIFNLKIFDNNEGKPRFLYIHP